MKQLLICLSLLATQVQVALANNDSLLTELDNTIRLTASFDAARIKEIDQMRQSLGAAGQAPAEVFARHEKIYEAYKIFNYDSAYSYAMKLVRIAADMNDAGYRVAATMKLSFILLSTGLYKETHDSLASLSRQVIPDSLKGDYYALWGRYYYDLAGYANDKYHSVDYDVHGNHFLDSALAWYQPGSFEHDYYYGLKYFKQSDRAEAARFLGQLMARPDLTQHQLALTASTLSAVYQQIGDIDQSIDLLVRATVADIKSSTKETVAIFHLAELLYKKGDLRHAALCIESAIANAAFYGARQRKVQVSSILPLIESERINGMEKQRSLLIRYATVVTLLVLALVVLTWIILRQVKKLKQTQEALRAANVAQQAINQQLQESNRQLAEVNEKLEEANKIKEEYIGYFFNMDSEFYSKIDKIKTTIEQKLQDKRYEDIRFFLNKIDARKEKNELLLSFDKIFLKLFPHFVQEVNTLLRPEEKIVLRDGELLNTDLRIFALMRMGVADPEKIASILEYSVKTIYSYKSRVKNKALVPGDEFEERIMQFKTL
ncbi:DUF6377 domain-containing protein [Paraflavitalea sp. CAU 1676]|uniref:DUF6377 domain-containing protein n=1 Tax=Paraflavitalea sp. CAU 1676 TaxID=3032598 RepID=UPI0023DB104F|nr:DUF6377 domain-containing protein [Paraflavitalea sp. CAU 1676]MDF2186794.1 DUF6377 domain-containing protein [Paraflavitalea sp. CAU 1676]